MKRLNALDDLGFIRGLDKSDMMGHILSFSRQCEEARRIGRNVKLPKSYGRFDNIVLSALGGSAIGADLLRSYLWDYASKPLYVNRNYTLPEFVNKSTVLFCASYSGDTEETLSSYCEGKKKNARIIILTSGGKLGDIARKDKIPCIIIPKGLPPRQALGYSFFPLLYAVCKLTGIKPDEKSIDDAISVIKQSKELFSPPRKTERNLAKKIALKLYGKLPVIYGGQDHIDAAVIRFRGQLEENSKHIGFSHIFPEMNHNEIVGWENPRAVLKNTAVVFLRDERDHPRTKLRIDITKEIISGYTDTVIEIFSKGSTPLARLFYLVYLCDFISFYLAVLNRVDPTPVHKVKYLKDILAKKK